MSAAARSPFARLSLLLAPLFASSFIGLGLGLACTSGGGGDCAAGTVNCQCAGGVQCYPGLTCLAGFCVDAGGDGETGDGDSGDGDSGDGDSGDGDGDGDNPCGDGQAFCGGKCVDTQSNILHCGDCDVACASDQLCYEGACATDCSESPCEGMTWCEPETSLCLPGCEYDEQCGPNQYCDIGNHTCVCEFGYKLCEGVCIYQDQWCADDCGNGILDPGEACDGAVLNGYVCTDFGYDGGTLSCLPDCSEFDTSNCENETCGNGVIDVGEQCDGVNLNGFDCVDLGFFGGTLSCSNCSYNTNNCIEEPEDSGNCCVVHAQPTCEVPQISQCVCALDPYCCNNQWDSACVSQAVDDCGAYCP